MHVYRYRMQKHAQARLSADDKKKLTQIATATRRSISEVIVDSIRAEHKLLDEAGVFRGEAVIVRRGQVDIGETLAPATKREA
jgi:predicted transcriptional regulator